jgi:hypothetical protein
MRTILACAACAVVTSAIIVAVSAVSEAAEPGQLCRTNTGTTLFTSETSGIYVPPNALVRIRDYRGPYHYLARYNGTTGQLARSTVNQSSCYYQ